jgi:hypothetical protein
MASLSRVPGPTSPFEGRSGRLIAIVLVGIGLAIAKPWNPSTIPGPSASPLPSGSGRPAAALVPEAATRVYDAASFGPEPPSPAWEIWAADRVTRVRFVGPADGFVPSTTPPSEPSGQTIEAGPVIDLGTADEVTALGINRPADMQIAALRLWRFRDGGEPERVPLHELPPPWPSPTFRVFVLRDARLAANTVLRWRPGLYRLDFLIDPADRIRSLLLVVRDGAGPVAEMAPGGAGSEVDPARLRRLPDAVTFWTFTTSLTGWAERAPAGDCRVSEIWRAANYDDACHPLWIGRPRALGVNLGGGAEVRSIRLREIDPLPGPVAVRERTDVTGDPGLAYVSPEAGNLADGIYRLDVATATADLTWYVEVGAGSIAFAR